MAKRSTLTRILAPLLITLSVLALLFAVVTWMPLRAARADWRHGRLADAITGASRWSRVRIWPNQYHQMLAIALLSARQSNAAQPHLRALTGKRLLLSIVEKDEVARRFFADGQARAFLQYDQAVAGPGERPEAALYRAAAYASEPALLPRAWQMLQTIDRAAVDSQKYDALRRAVEQRRSGRVAWVFDRRNRTIAEWESGTGQLRAPDADFQAIVNRSAGDLTLGARRDRLGVDLDIVTTLDSDVQHAAAKALGNYRGALVAIDPRTNELLAIVSHDPSGAIRNHALQSQYEPGSIVKVLTGMNALQAGVDVDAMLPYHCQGQLQIDGRRFGDWLPQGHGLLPDVGEALAQSCNVFFADLGLRVGEARLESFMARAGFDQQADLGLFQVPLGRIRRQEVFNRFETGFLAIGLEHESVTALHIAMLASMMANRGELTSPRLLLGRRSILGEMMEGAPVQTRSRLASPAVAERMIGAMVAVVTRPKGTGRRAALEGIPLALKTGTAGKREEGYLAVILAFAPVRSPRIAFGIVAENAGPAEFAGAQIAHDFLEQLASRLR